MGLLEAFKNRENNNPGVRTLRGVKAANSVPNNIGVLNPDFNQDPKNVQYIQDLGADNTWNSFFNAIAHINASSNHQKLRDLDYKTRIIDKDIYDSESKLETALQNNDTYSAEIYKQKVATKRKEREDYELSVQEDRSKYEEGIKSGTGLTGLIAGGLDDIAARKNTIEYQNLADYYQKNVSTDFLKAFKYELPHDMGSSFSTLGATVVGMLAPKFLKYAVPRMVAASGRTPGPVQAKVLGGAFTLAVAAGELYMHNYARNEETNAELDESYSQATNEAINQYALKNGITDPAELETNPKHKKAINDIHIKAYEQLDDLRLKNMSLQYGDMLQTVLAVTPYSKLAQRFGGGTRFSRTAQRIGAATLSLNMEMNEEGSQWLYQQQYLNKFLEQGKTGLLDDKTNYNDNTVGGILTKGGKILNDRFQVEKNIFAYSDYDLYSSKEFRSAVNSGAFAAGPMVGIPQAVGIVSDFHGFHKAKQALGRAAKQESESEYLKFKYDTYERFIDNNKSDYFIENIRNLAKIEGSGITSQDAEKEIARFQKAKKEFDKIDDPQYIFGIVEMYDFRGISKKDRKRAIKNSLMIGELGEQMAEIDALQNEKNIPYYENTGILGELEETDDKGNTTKKPDSLSNRKTLFEALLDPEKAKNLNKNEVYDDFDIPYVLKARAAAKLQKENKDIASGKFTARNKANTKIAKTGTDAQRNSLSFKYGIQYSENANMVGLDGKNIGEEEYFDMLEDLAATSLLRDMDKRANIERMLNLEGNPTDIAIAAMSSNAPLTQGLFDRIQESLENKLYTLLDQASNLKDNEGNEGYFINAQELRDAAERGEDPDYEAALKEVLNQVDDLNTHVNNLDMAHKDLIRDPQSLSYSKEDKEWTYLQDRFFKEMEDELSKALNDDDYNTTNVLDRLENKLKWLKEVLNEEKQLNTTSTPHYIGIANHLDYLEDAFEQAKAVVRERLANKDLEQEKSYTLSTEESLLGIGIEYAPNDDKTKLIQNKLGLPDDIFLALQKFVEEIAVQDKNGKWYLHHSYAEAMKEYILNSVPEIDKTLEETEAEALNNFYLFVKGKYASRYPSAPPLEQLIPKEVAALDIDSFLTSILQAIKEGLTNDLENPITEFMTTRDIKILLNAKDDLLVEPRDSTPKDVQIVEFKNIINFYRTIKSMQITRKSITTRSTKTQLQTEINIFNQLTGYLPTKQQIVALRQLSSWYTSTTKPVATAILLGYAGSGKTHVITKLFLSMVGLSPKDVVAVAPTAMSNSNLANAIGHIMPTSTDPVKDFLEAAEETFKDKKLIIIDEAGLLNGEQIKLINAKTQALELLYGVKTVMLGDPTQYSKIMFPAFLSFSSGNNYGKVFITPLTITYRTDDIDIIRTQKAYRNKSNKVTTVNSGITADKKFGSIGVTSAQDVYNLIIKNKPHGREQVVIVNSIAEVAKVQAELAANGITGVKVYSLIEAQSNTFDEVYTMLTPSGEFTPQKNNYFRFNKAMYVATSRARFLSVVLAPSTHFTNDTKTLLQSEQKKVITPTEKTAFIKDLQDQLAAITNSSLNTKLGTSTTAPGTTSNPAGPANPGPTPSTPGVDPDAPIDEEFDDTGQSDVDQDSEILTEDKEEINEGISDLDPLSDANEEYVPQDTDHIIRFPQYSTIKNNSQKIGKDAPVKYLRYFNKAKKEAGVVIVAKAKDGKWYIIGIVGKNELNETDKFKLPKELISQLKDPQYQLGDANDIDLDNFDDDGSFKGEESDLPYALLDGKLKKATPKHLIWNDTLIKLKNYIENFHALILKRYAETSQNMTNFNLKDADKWEVKVYNRKEIAKDGLNPKIVKPGVPYLVFSITHKKGKQEKIHVPMNGRKFNKETDKESIAPMQTFLLNIKTIQAILERLDGDTKIKFGGLEPVPGYTYKLKDGTEGISNQGEVFKDLLQPTNSNTVKIFAELEAKGVDITELKTKLKEVRDALFTPLDLMSFGYNPTGQLINEDGLDERYQSSYFITGEKGSRKVVPGATIVGKEKYTEHPTLKGFFLIEKGTKGEKAWRSVYSYKGLQVKIDIPITAEGEGTPVFELHSESEMKAKHSDKRNHNRVEKGGTRIMTGRIYNPAVHPRDYIDSLISNNMIYDRNNQGIVQKIFDSISRSNSHVKIGDEKFWLRQTHDEFKDGTPTGRKFFKGLDLLYTFSTGTDAKNKRAKASYTHVYKMKSGQTIPTIETMEPNPITVEVLEQMIGEDAFNPEGNSVMNRGFGLRIPIHTSTVSKQDSQSEEEYQQYVLEKLSEDLEINLGGINPTEIVVGDIHDKGVPAGASTSSTSEPSTTGPITPPTSTNILDDVQPDSFSFPFSDPDDDGDNWIKDGDVTPIKWRSQEFIRKVAASIFGEKFANDPAKLVFLTKSQMIAELGVDSWGHHSKGVVYLQTDENGRASVDVLRHESLHRVLHVFFSEAQRFEVYNLATYINPELRNKNFKAKEEWLAEQYTLFNRNNMLVSRLLWKLFIKLKTIFDFQLTNDEKLRRYFFRINQGNYKGATSQVHVGATGMDALKIMEWFGTTPNKDDASDNYNAAQIAILRSLASKIWPKITNGDHSRGIRVKIRTFTDNKTGKTHSKLKNVVESPIDSLKAVYSDLLQEFNDKKENSPKWLAILVNPKNTHIYENVFKYLVKGESVNWDALIENASNMSDPSLKDEIEESHRINYENKLLATVKNMFSSIFVEIEDKDGKTQSFEYIPGRQVFYRAMQLLKGVDNLDMDAILIIKENLKKFKGDLKMERVGEFLEDIIRRTRFDRFTLSVNSEGKPFRAYLPVNLKVTSNALFLDGKVLEFNDPLVQGRATRISPNGNRDSSTADFVARMVKALKNSSVEVKDPSGKVIKFSTLTEEQIANMLATLLAKEEATQLLAGIQSGVVSLVESNPYVGITTIENTEEVPGDTDTETKIKYIPNKLLGGEETIIFEFQDILLKFFKDAALHAELGKIRDILNVARNADNDKIKKDSITGVFSKLKVPYTTVDLSTNQIETIIGALYPIVSRVYASIGTNTTAEGVEKFLDEDENNRFNEIKQSLALSQNFGENSAYLDSKNRKSYKFIRGSYFNRTMEKLLTYFRSTNKGILNIPEFLKPESVGFQSYFKYNPFLREKNRRIIHQLIDHDALKIQSKGSFESQFATAYKNEGMNGWVLRNILFGFVANITKNTDKLKYIQFPYTPSNKPTLRGLEVNVSTEEQLRDDIRTAIVQQLGRYSWFEKLAENGVFIKGVPLKIEKKGDKISFVWTKDLRDGFSKHVKGRELSDQEIDKIVDLTLEDLLNDSYTWYKFIKDNEGFKVNAKNIRVNTSPENLSIEDASRTVTALRNKKVITDAKFEKLQAFFNSKYEFSDKRTVEEQLTEGEYKYALNTFLIVHEGYSQNFVNGHFTNQLQMSDKIFYKHATEQVKRGALGIAPGDNPLTDVNGSGIGMKPFINILVAADDNRAFNRHSDVIKAYNTLYGFFIKSTDAQMYFLPEWGDELNKGYSLDYGLGNVIKPVLYFIDKFGIPRSSKNSGIKLTDQLVSKFPELKLLRDEMRQHNIMEYHMESAVKSGIPARIVSRNETITQHLQPNDQVLGNGLIEVPTKYYSIQNNPSSEEGDITNFSQLTYFLNVNNNNAVATNMIYEIDAIITNREYDKWIGKLGKFVGDEFEANEGKVREMLAKAITTIPGNERYGELLLNKGPDGNYLVDLNFPAIRNRVEISLMSASSKNSVGTLTNSGNKLVLGSAYGIGVYRLPNGETVTYDDLSTVDKNAANHFYSLPRNIRDALKTKANSIHLSSSKTFWDANKDEMIEYAGLTIEEKEFVDKYDLQRNPVPTKLNMVTDINTMSGRVAEVIAPAWWKRYAKAKGMDIEVGYVFIPDDFLTRLAFGVRIPTTGIHSAVPFKIVGFTESSTNIILAPEELVALHGSDFDVDSLFAVHVEILTDPKNKKSKTLMELRDLAGNIVISAGQRLGWPNVTFNSFEEMMLAQGATEKNIATKEFDSQIGLLTKLEMEVNNAIFTLTNNEEGDSKENKEALKELKLKKDLIFQAITKIHKNKKTFAMYHILLNEVNYTDMKQPITFEILKEDFFDIDSDVFYASGNLNVYNSDGTLNPAFVELLTEENRFIKIVDKFLTWGINKDTAGVLKLDEKENKLIITDPAIRNAIFNDETLSVLMRLKLLYGILDFAVGRDLNNQMHNFQYYMENFAGVSLTGAFANFVKALAYVYYAAPSDANFVTPTGEKISIQIDDKVYDKIEVAEKRDGGKKIWEVLDTLINGAIDNVKEQVLAMINANNSTGSMITTMVSLGIPMDKIAMIFNQPILMEEATKISTFDADRSTKRFMKLLKESRNILQANHNLDNKEIEVIKNSPLTTKELEDSLVFARTNKTSWKTMPKQEAITQYKVMIMYSSVFPVSQRLSKTANVINIIRDFPVTPDEINTLKKNIEDIEEYSGIEGANIFSIPHIKAAKETFLKSSVVRESILHSRSPKFLATLIEMFEDFTGISINSDEQSKTIAEEFDAYILSIVTTLSPLDTEWKKTVTIKTGEDKTIYLTGNDAWIHNFALALEKLKLEFPTNEFLRYLKPQMGSDGTYKEKWGNKGNTKIYWTLGSITNEPGISASLQGGFLKLPEEFKDAIMKFAALEQGLNFGLRSYSSLIDPLTLGKASKYYTEIFDKALDPVEFKKFGEHFLLPFLFRNPEFMSDFFNGENKIIGRKGLLYKSSSEKFNNLLGGRKASKYDGIISYAPYTDKEGKEKTPDSPPKFFTIKGERNAVYFKVDEDPNISTAYYVKIGHLTGTSLYKNYNIDLDVLTQGYSLKDSFDRTDKIMSVNPELFGNDTVILKYSNVYEDAIRNVGETVMVKSFVDSYNKELIPYVITKVVLGNKQSYSLKDTEGNPKEVSTKIYDSVEVSMEKAEVKPQVKEQRSNVVSNTLGVNAVTKLLAKLQKALKLDYSIEDFNNFDLITELGLNPNIMGFFHNGKVYLNKNKLNAETPIHEFGHGLLIIIKNQNKVLYNNLVRTIQDSSILQEIKQSYPDLSLEDQIDEAIVTAIGRYGANMTQTWSKALISAIKRIFDSILRLFGQYKPIDVRELDPSTSILNLAEMLLDQREIGQLQENLDGTFELKYLFNDLNLVREIGTETDAGYLVATSTGSKILERVSTFLTKFKPYDSTKLPEEWRASNAFKELKVPETGTIPHPKFPTIMLTYKDAVEYFKSDNERRRISGKILHKMIQIALLGINNINLGLHNTQLANLFTEYQANGGNPQEFNWLINNDDYIKGLKQRLGITDTDELLPEFLIYNEELKLGGTIDLLIKHQDGTFSIFDFKSGSLSPKDKSHDIMLYGNKSKFLYHTLNMNQMQLGTYAMLLKLKYPNTRFKNITLASIRSNSTEVGTVEVNKSAVFSVLREYFNVNKNSAITNNPFVTDHKEYTSVSSSLSDRIKQELESGRAGDVYAAANLVLQELYKQLDKLRRTGGKDDEPITDAYIMSSPNLRARLEKLTLQIAELKGSEFGSMLDVTGDMNLTEKLTSVGFNVKNPLVKTLIKLISEASRRVRLTQNELFSESDRLTKLIKDDYYREHPLSKAGGLIGLNMLSYQDVFDFMWDIDSDGARNIVTEDSAKWSTLSNNQKKYNVFYRDSIRDLMFKTLSSEKGKVYYTDKLDKLSSDVLIGLFSKEELRTKYQSKIDEYNNMVPVEKWAAELGKTFVYTENFTPRLPKLQEEVSMDDLLKNPKQIFTNLGNWALHKVTSYTVEPNDSFGLKPIGVPLKYINDYGAYDLNQTTHTELILKLFGRNMINKQNYDDVSSFGLTLSVLFSTGSDKIEKALKQADFIKSYVVNNLHEVYETNTNVAGSTIAHRKFFGRDISFERSLKSLQGATTLAKLGFGSIGALSSGVLNVMMYHKEAFKNSLAYRLTDIEKEDLAFTSRDLALAYANWMMYIGEVILNQLTGKPITHKFHFMDELYNVSQQEFIGSGNKKLLNIAKNRLLDDNWFYLTYGLGDRFANSLIFMSIMNNKQVKQKDGSSKSLWDSYEVKNNKLEWTGGVRGRIETGELITDLTGQEILNFKKITARLLGEYDKDMKRQMESNAMLSIFLQFKKYLPNKIENAFQGYNSGEFENASLGKYIEVLDHESGKKIVDIENNPILQWESQRDKGMSLVTAKVIQEDVFKSTIRGLQRMLYLNSAVKKDMYAEVSYYSTLSAEQKQHVITQTLNFATWGLMYGAAVAFYGDADDDDKDPIKRRFMDLRRDLTIEFNGMEMLRILNKPTVVLPVLLQTVEGVDKLMFGKDPKRKPKKDAPTAGMKDATSLLPLSSFYNQIIKDPWYKSK